MASDGGNWNRVERSRARWRMPRSTACCSRIYPMTNGTALHEDDRMVTILAGDGRGQAENVPRLCPARHELEARRGQMMAFIDDQMAVVRHEVGDFPLR